MTKDERRERKSQLKSALLKEREEKRNLKVLSKEEKEVEKARIKLEKQERKLSIKRMDKQERKRAKKFDRMLKRRRHAKIKWSIVGAVVLFIISTLSYQFYLGAKPESDVILEAKEASRLVAEEVQKEGTVLLKNDDNFLPLKGNKVNLFGVRSITPSYGGGGSGSVDYRKAVQFYETLDEVGIEYNKEIFNLYCNWGFDGKISTKEYKIDKSRSYIETVLPNIMGILGSEKFAEIPVADIPKETLENAQAFSDTAIMVVGLSSRETISADGVSDNLSPSLQLGAEDKALLEYLNANFENIIVLLNSGNPLELGWLEEYSQIKSALWIGYPGEVGFRAVSKILTGEYNPSGRTVDTFAYDTTTAPASANVGNFTYENLPDQHFMNYTEGIYVGYRFYETYYQTEEAYRSAVQFPFGYGLSYTTFDWETLKIDPNLETEKITIDVKVTNTGDRAGKDVVQIYHTPPFAEKGIEKAHKNLVGFKKTEELKPNESETLTIVVNFKDMMSYDDKNLEGWILEKGDYTISVSKNAHDVFSSQDFTLPQDLTLKTDEKTGTKIENLFDDANAGLNYLSRSNFDQGIKTLENRNYTAPQSVIDATKYSHEKTAGTLPTVNEFSGIMLKDLEGLSYDDPKWEKFLDQFKLNEMIDLVSSAGWQTIAVERLGVPETFDVDGPASMRHYFSKWSTVAFPNAMTVTQSWNEDLETKMASSMAKEGVLYGIDVWYAPAMNLHRTAFGGRNFEYMSEDPFISGKTASAQIRGAQSEGLGVTIKHFALNESETNRTGVFLWSNEQALRELYFKPFEMSVKEGGAFGAMSSMTRVGHTWCGENSMLLNDLLREEWGFRGYVVTDITIGNYMFASKCITNGNDAMLFLLSGGHAKNIKEAYKTDPIGIANGLRTSTKNICYMKLQTNAMDDVR